MANTTPNRQNPDFKQDLEAERLRQSRNNLARLMELEKSSAQDRNALGFLDSLFITTNLPYRQPKDEVYVRTNGDRSLTIEGGLDGQQNRLPIPYGKLPRALLVWMNTEAVRTESPIIEMTSSLPTMLQNLGISWGGGTGKRFMVQVQALLEARMSVRMNRRVGNARRDTKLELTVSSGYDLYFSERDNSLQDSLFPSRIVLSQDFYRSIIESSVPIDMHAWAYLSMNSKSPMVLDIYTWLLHRLCRVKRPVLVTWEQLAVQFGGSFDRLRDFRASFITNMQKAIMVYPTAADGITIDEKGQGLWLKHVPSPVPKKGQLL